MHYINDAKKKQVTTLEMPNNVGKKTMEKSNAFPVC